ncbi:MAG: hypothetical protein JWO80_4496 [Bryobacterales bacterium]|nr:hypothetical protein [Bryobacterales bacterium]
MTNLRVQALIAAALTANLSLVSAATPAIGVAFSNGTLLINNASTVGNASIFDGSTVETNATASRLHLKSGADVQLSSASRGKVYSNRMVLEKGVMELKAAGKYGIEARSLQITGTDSDAAAKVSIHGTTVQVASIAGHVQVANASGAVVANIAPGMAFDFTPQDQGASAPSGGNKQTPPAAGGASGAGAGSGIGLSHTGVIVAAVVVVGAVGSTAGVLASQGTTNVPPNGISPGRP